MKVFNNNQLYKSPAGDQLWNSGRQNWIFGRIGDQEGAISDPVFPLQWGRFLRGQQGAFPVPVTLNNISRETKKSGKGGWKKLAAKIPIFWRERLHEKKL